MKGIVVSEFLGSILRFILKFILGVMAIVFAVSLLVVALLAVAFTLLKALLTGKKPTPAVVFSRFRQYSSKDLWRRSASATRSPGTVVDVEVREVTTAMPPTDSVKPTTTRNVQVAGNVSDVQPKERTQHAD